MYRNSKGTWHQIGHAPVDSGTMMLVDPCYVLRDKRDEGKPNNGLEYSEALGFELPEDHPESYRSRDNYRASGNYEAAYALGGNGRHSGFFFDTNWGDGSYPVFARIGEDGRTTGVYISFADEEEDEYDAEDLDEL